MSTQRKEILQAMQSDPDWLWSYDELHNALPHISLPSLRTQAARLVKTGGVTREDSGLLRLSTTPRNSALESPTTSADATITGVTGEAPVTGSRAASGATGGPVMRNASASADAPAGTRPPSLNEHEAYKQVLDALPIPALRSAFKLATALAFVRSELSGCKAPALATCGRAGTGKTVLWEALSILLHGDTDAVTDARNLTSKQQVIGRREKVDNVYIATPSVLFAPPDKPAPRMVVFDEIGERIAPDVLKGVGMVMKLEPFYMIEGTKLDITALVAFAFNKPKGFPHGAPWTPFQWEGAARRMLVCDLDFSSDYLKGGAAKQSARRVFGVLAGADTIDLSAYAIGVHYPSVSLLERADAILSEVFADASELPLGDPVLRGLTAAFGSLYGLSTERAMLAALADIATVVGTLPGLLRPDAEVRLNTRLREAGLEPVALPKVREPELTEDSAAMTLSPAQRARIAAHLAQASVKSTSELLETLEEYELVRRRFCWVRLPRFCLEVFGRAVLAFGFTLIAAGHNVALAPLLKLPRFGGSDVYAVWRFGVSTPRTRLFEHVTPSGDPVVSPRRFVLSLFGDDLAARAQVTLEDAARGESTEVAEHV